MTKFLPECYNPAPLSWYLWLNRSYMHQVLLIGAGKSATVLIDYLSEHAANGFWEVVVADRDTAALSIKIGDRPGMRATSLDITDDTKRAALVANADIVISMLPPHLHLSVAKDCCRLRKHLLTASYTDDAVRTMQKEIDQVGVLFLYEMGLDPGIDHMSAMRLIDHIRKAGGDIRRFLSHCGGLVAPESDRNPWHYLFTWNPRNVVQAGKAGARFRQQGEWVTRTYAEVFDNPARVSVDGLPALEAYPNRDVQHYLSLYGLADATDFQRTTLRFPPFCAGWQTLIRLGMTSEAQQFDTSQLSYADFWQQAFSKTGCHLHDLPAATRELIQFLEPDNKAHIAIGQASSADILLHILEKKWKLFPGDKDMIVMQHEIGYTLNHEQHKVTSSLVVKGEDDLRTAMARTVGLPLGIAARLLLNGAIRVRGLQIPCLPEIYTPVLAELENRGIVFQETNE